MNLFRINKNLLNLIILLIRIYQNSLSIYIGNNCRYIPSCSQYMIISLQRYGILKGIFFGIRRIFTCHPWKIKNFF